MNGEDIGKDVVVGSRDWAFRFTLAKYRDVLDDLGQLLKTVNKLPYGEMRTDAVRELRLIQERFEMYADGALDIEQEVQKLLEAEEKAKAEGDG
jgi:hypothetical protein